jgi:hypothetical protein
MSEEFFKNVGEKITEVTKQAISRTNELADRIAPKIEAGALKTKEWTTDVLVPNAKHLGE